MSVAILSSLIDGTGNRATAERIFSYLQCEYTVHLCETNDYKDTGQFISFLNEKNVKAVIGIHLVKAGQLLVMGNIPFVIIAGGTDMNISVKKCEEVDIMTKVMKRARRLIVFTSDMRKKAVDLWPSMQQKILQQPQGVHASVTSYTFSDLFRDYHNVEMNFENMKVFLIAGGIRSVKDPIYLAEVMSNWHFNEPSIFLVIIGPVLDKEYASQCYETINKLQGVYIFSEISPDKVHSLMKHSVALINSSHSEGMCGAIMEAMFLGIPVIARKNEGNLSLISDQENGLIYESKEEFFMKAVSLLSDQILKETLIQNGKLHIEKNHPMNKEKETYLKLMQEVIAKEEEQRNSFY